MAAPTLSGPTLSGLHHATFPVGDLPASVSWYERVLRAEHLPALDRVDADDEWFAAMLDLPGTGTVLQLRLNRDVPVAFGESPVTFSVPDRAELDRWVEHLDACAVPHFPGRGRARRPLGQVRVCGRRRAAPLHRIGGHRRRAIGRSVRTRRSCPSKES